MLTLAAFLATATRMSVAEAENCLGTHLTDSTAAAVWVYAGSAYIEELSDGRFYLVIGRSEWLDADRDLLAGILYRDYWLPEQGWDDVEEPGTVSAPAPAPATAAPPAPAAPIVKVCKTCGSDRVFVDANAEWDYANQMWVLGDFCDERQAWCLDCDGTTSIVDRSG
jgi:hypothetical protein